MKWALDPNSPNEITLVTENWSGTAMNNLLNIKSRPRTKLRVQSDYGLLNKGLANLKPSTENLPSEALVEEIIFRVGNDLAPGPVVVNTGKHTPRRTGQADRARAVNENQCGGMSKTPAAADSSTNGLAAARPLEGRDLFVQDCYAGANPDYRLPFAW
jgi:phosphoenolpyruvate carboxykinase (ATP)